MDKSERRRRLLRLLYRYGALAAPPVSALSKLMDRYRIYGDPVLMELARTYGECAICHKGHYKGLIFDHDHKTGLFRGLLCMTCNAGMGQVGEANLLSAARYLRLVD